MADDLRNLLDARDKALVDHLERLGFDVTRIKLILPLYGRGRAKRASRTIVLTDDSRTTILSLLAKFKDPSFNETTHLAAWVKPDPGNEHIDNVEVTTKESLAKRRHSRYEAKAGTAEYHKEYREKNKERIRAAARRSYHKSKVFQQELEQRQAAGDPSHASSLLDDILKR